MVIAAYRVGCVNSVMTDLQGNPARLAKSARALRPFGRDEGARPEKRDLAGALAEGEVLCSRQLARAWTSRGTRFRIAVWWLLGTSTALDEATFGCGTSSHALDRSAELVRREAGSPCKSAMTEFTHPTGSLLRASVSVARVSLSP